MLKQETPFREVVAKSLLELHQPERVSRFPKVSGAGCGIGDWVEAANMKLAPKKCDGLHIVITRHLIIRSVRPLCCSGLRKMIRPWLKGGTRQWWPASPCSAQCPLGRPQSAVACCLNLSGPAWELLDAADAFLIALGE